MRRVNREFAHDEQEARRYPDDWQDFRLRLIEEAGGRCRCDGRCRKDHPGGVCAKAAAAGFTLQIAHLDDTPEHLAADNLLVMCRSCHLSYDNGRKRGKGITRPSSIRVNSNHTDFEEKHSLREAAWAEIDPPADGWLWLPFCGAGDLILEHWRTAPREKRWWWNRVAASDHDCGAVAAFRERFRQVDIEERRSNKVAFRPDRVFAGADIDAFADVDAMQALYHFFKHARFARRVAIVLTMPAFTFSRSRVFSLPDGHVVTNRMLRDEIRADPRPRIESWVKGQRGVVSLREVAQSVRAKRKDRKVHYVAYLVERKTADAAACLPAAPAATDSQARSGGGPLPMPAFPEIPLLVQ